MSLTVAGDESDYPPEVLSDFEAKIAEVVEPQVDTSKVTVTVAPTGTPDGRRRLSEENGVVLDVVVVADSAGQADALKDDLNSKFATPEAAEAALSPLEVNVLAVQPAVAGTQTVEDSPPPPPLPPLPRSPPPPPSPPPLPPLDAPDNDDKLSTGSSCDGGCVGGIVGGLAVALVVALAVGCYFLKRRKEGKGGGNGNTMFVREPVGAAEHESSASDNGLFKSARPPPSQEHESSAKPSDTDPTVNVHSI